MAVRIKHVYGNVLRLAIPLTLRTVTLEDGDIQSTDTDFIPTGDVSVILGGKGPVKYTLHATMRDGNVAVVEDKGNLPIGTYYVEILCNDSNGNPMRFKQKCVIEVIDVTAEAGIDPGIEYESQEWLLDGAIFMALRGDDGVGIADIVIQENTAVGGQNTITITLTDGTEYVFHVLNGSYGVSGIIMNNQTYTFNEQGLVDLGTVITAHQSLDNYHTKSEITSILGSYPTKAEILESVSTQLLQILSGGTLNPVNIWRSASGLTFRNTENTGMVNLVIPQGTDSIALGSDLNYLLSQVFGDVVYDRTVQRINFYAKNDPSHTVILSSIDVSPFVVDGMLSDVRTINNNLQFIFNTDSGKTPIVIPLSEFFDASLYYTKVQLNAMFNNFYNAETIDDILSRYYPKTDNLAPLNQEGRIDYSTLPRLVLDGVNKSVPQVLPPSLSGKTIHYSDGKIRHWYTNSNLVVTSFVYTPSADVVYYCTEDEKFYIFDGSAMVAISAGGGGVQASYSNGTITFTGSGSSHPTYSNGTITL